MSLESNSGTQYYGISCGIPSDSGVDINSNIFTGYYYKEPNDYILWGQDTLYQHVSSNIGSSPYFLQCDVASESGLNLESNYGTHYYYNSAFNCVGFCINADIPSFGPDPGYVFVYVYSGDEQIVLNDETPLQVPEEYANA